MSLLNLQKKLQTLPLTGTRIEEFKSAVQDIYTNTATLLSIKVNLFGHFAFETCVENILEALCFAYTAYNRDLPEHPVELWGETTVPGVDFMRAKLARYSSNLYAETFANPDTVLDSNMDYDLRQYTTFLYVYCEHNGLDIMGVVQNVYEQVSKSLV